MNDEFCNENSPLELKYIECVGLGVFAKTDLKKKHDNEKLRSLLTGIVNLKMFEGVEWSFTEIVRLFGKEEWILLEVWDSSWSDSKSKYKQKIG